MARDHSAVVKIYNDFVQEVAQPAHMEIGNAFIDGLKLANVILENDAARLKAKETPIERRVLLFLDIMPLKDPQNHTKLINFLKSEHYGDAADFLFGRLFAPPAPAADAPPPYPGRGS